MNKKTVILDDEEEDWNDWDLEDEDETEEEDEIKDEDLEEEEKEEDENTRGSSKNDKGGKKRETGKGGQKGAGKDKKGGSSGEGFISTFMHNPYTKWSSRVVITILVVILFLAQGFPAENIRDDTGISDLPKLFWPRRYFPEKVEATMSIQFDLSISGGNPTDLAQKVEIDVAPPFDIPSEGSQSRNDGFVLQDVTDVQMDPFPDNGVMDWDHGQNNKSSWILQNEKGDFQFTATFNLTLYTYEWDINTEDSGTISDYPLMKYNDYQRYLETEWPVTDPEGDPNTAIDHDGDGREDYRYDPNFPMVQRIAQNLTKDKPTVLGKVRAIYDWIQDHFNYTNDEQRKRDNTYYRGYPKYTSGILTDWYGDCDDQSLLMASLCRAVGIPAWLEIGYLYDPRSDSWGGHGWFNVAIPVRTTDGYEVVVAPIDPVNQEFLFRDPYRITDWIDTGGMYPPDAPPGEKIFNLDYYYNYFSKIPGSPPPNIDISQLFKSDDFKEHGQITVYVDEDIRDASLPGSQGGMNDVPAPSPFLFLAPLSLLLIAVPMRRYMIKRS